MSRENIEYAKIFKSLLGSAMSMDCMIETLAATRTLPTDCPPLLFLDPGGAGRTVNLPAEARGLFIILVNTADANEVITVKEDSSTTTIVTLTQNEIALLFCDGTTWRGVVGVA